VLKSRIPPRETASPIKVPVSYERCYSGGARNWKRGTLEQEVSGSSITLLICFGFLPSKTFVLSVQRSTRTTQEQEKATMPDARARETDGSNIEIAYSRVAKRPRQAYHTAGEALVLHHFDTFERLQLLDTVAGHGPVRLDQLFWSS
jgi:hypothetical protein